MTLRAPFMPRDHAGGERRSIARCAHAFGGQGYVQHYSATKPKNLTILHFQEVL